MTERQLELLRDIHKAAMKLSLALLVEEAKGLAIPQEVNEAWEELTYANKVFREHS